MSQPLDKRTSTPIAFEDEVLQLFEQELNSYWRDVIWATVSRVNKDGPSTSPIVRWHWRKGGAPPESVNDAELSDFFMRTQTDPNSLINKAHNDFRAKGRKAPLVYLRYHEGNPDLTAVVQEHKELYHVGLFPISELPEGFARFVPPDSFTALFLVDDPLAFHHGGPIAAATLCFKAAAGPIIRELPVLRLESSVRATRLALADRNYFTPWELPPSELTFDDLWEFLAETSWGHGIDDALGDAAGIISGFHFAQQGSNYLQLDLEPVTQSCIPKQTTHPKLYAAYEAAKGALPGRELRLGTIILVVSFLAKQHSATSVSISEEMGTAPLLWGRRQLDPFIKKEILRSLCGLLSTCWADGPWTGVNCYRLSGRLVLDVNFEAKAGGTARDLEAALRARRVNPGLLVEKQHGMTSFWLHQVEYWSGLEVMMNQEVESRPGQLVVKVCEPRNGEGSRRLCLSFCAPKSTDG